MEVCVISKGILKWEWQVRPPGSSREAIPNDATANAIFPWLLTELSKVVHKNVFLVPPWP
jgi:hypothetical protein